MSKNKVRTETVEHGSVDMLLSTRRTMHAGSRPSRLSNAEVGWRVIYFRLGSAVNDFRPFVRLN